MSGAEITPAVANVMWTESMHGMALVSKEGKIRDANPKLCELLSYPRGELVGKHFRDITHPDDYYMDQAEFGHLLTGELDRYSMWKRYLTRDGRVVGLKLKVVAVRVDGDIEIVLGQVSDALRITPTTPRDEKLEASRLLGKFIIEHWKLVTMILLAMTGVANAPQILKLFLAAG